jgi:hypothetical protein
MYSGDHRRPSEVAARLEPCSNESKRNLLLAQSLYRVLLSSILSNCFYPAKIRKLGKNLVFGLSIASPMGPDGGDSKYALENATLL